MVFKITGIGADNPRDDEMAYGHAHAAADENRPSTEIVNPKDSWDSKDKLEYSCNSRG